MRLTQAIYLGPEGTFSHLVARKRFGRALTLVPQASVFDVFACARARPSRVCIVPIENSSGGTIYDTVDGLVDPASNLTILEDLSLNVRLALLGRKGQEIRTVYSHFAPMAHCEAWLRRHLPQAQRKAMASTAGAAERAAAEPHAAALGTREAGRRLGLDVLVFPVHAEVPNITQFFVVGHPRRPEPHSSRTTLVATLPNRPGSLCDFLSAFRAQKVNLTRLLSRPIVGQPKSYLFFVDVDGTPGEPRVQRALEDAAREATSLRTLGVYPVRRMYVS